MKMILDEKTTRATQLFALKKITYKSNRAQMTEKNIKADWGLCLKESFCMCDISMC